MAKKENPLSENEQAAAEQALQNTAAEAEQAVAKQAEIEQAAAEQALQNTAAEAEQAVAKQAEIDQAAVEQAKKDVKKSKFEFEAESIAHSYAPHYPALKALHVCTDKMVFLEGDIAEAQAHQLILGKGKVLTISINK